MRLLNAGNVVTLGLQIYRSRLKLYFGLALAAHLWLIIPFYGWAKFLAISALISRLAYGELLGETETVKSERKQIYQRKWSFLFTGFLVFLIVFVGGIILLVGTFLLLMAFLQGVSYWFTGYQLGRNQVLGIVLFFLVLLVVLLIILGFIAAVIWIYSRFFIAEMPLAMEDKMNSFRAIGRSWNITENSVFRIQMILTISFIISLPATIIMEVIIEIINFLDSYLKLQYTISLNIVSFGIILLTSALILPFFQVIKAVLYYDLRNRREGLGLRIGDRNNLDQN